MGVNLLLVGIMSLVDIGVFDVDDGTVRKGSLMALNDDDDNDDDDDVTDDFV